MILLRILQFQKLNLLITPVIIFLESDKLGMLEADTIKQVTMKEKIKKEYV